MSLGLGVKGLGLIGFRSWGVGIQLFIGVLRKIGIRIADPLDREGLQQASKVPG